MSVPTTTSSSTSAAPPKTLAPAPDVQEHEHVQHGEPGEGDGVHEDQVGPGDVHADVDGVASHRSRHDVGPVAKWSVLVICRLNSTTS